MLSRYMKIYNFTNQVLYTKNDSQPLAYVQPGEFWDTIYHSK